MTIHFLQVKRMNFIKASILVTALSSIFLTSVQAEEVTTLPTIKVMADAELRDEEVKMAPLQEDKNVRKALQKKIIKSEQDIQNYVIGDSANIVNVQPKAPPIDMSGLSPMMQEYVLAVAAGLQSSDPTSGLMTMLQPVSMGLTRDQAIEAVKNGSFKLNIDTDRLNLMMGDNKWQNNLPTNKR